MAEKEIKHATSILAAPDSYALLFTPRSWKLRPLHCLQRVIALPSPQAEAPPRSRRCVGDRGVVKADTTPFRGGSKEALSDSSGAAAAAPTSAAHERAGHLYLWLGGGPARRPFFNMLQGNARALPQCSVELEHVEEGLSGWAYTEPQVPCSLMSGAGRSCRRGSAAVRKGLFGPSAKGRGVGL